MANGARNSAHDHQCPWPGCPKHVSPRLWGCRFHYFKLPAEIRKRIFDARFPWSIEREDTPSMEYRAALNDAARWIAAYIADDAATHR